MTMIALKSALLLEVELLTRKPGRCEVFVCRLDPATFVKSKSDMKRQYKLPLQGHLSVA